MKFELADICKECFNKHKEMKGKFDITCKGIPQTMMHETNPYYPLDSLMHPGEYANIPEQVKIQQQLLKNKVLWAQECLGWSTFNKERGFDQWYQKQMLNCTSKFKVFRCGRRIGKTETIAIDALHYALNFNNKSILIIGPFQNLVDEIFDRLCSLLDGQESIYQDQYTRKRQPNVIKFENGSSIKGFTTGQNGDSIRGQSADRIYLDEGAYIPPAAFRSVLALLMENSSVELIVASTPSSFETNFKKWCLTDPTFKDFHFPSTILPNYEDVKELFKNSYSSDDFKLEILAEFVEGSNRVFKSRDVAVASETYNYIFSRAELENPNEWIISIGADWNEFKNGIQIVVTGFNKRDTTGKPFKILLRESIHANIKGIQTLGVERIKQLHESFKAEHVYVDQGFGGMQAEILNRYFIVEKQLYNVFKSIDFSSTYQFVDPITQQTTNRRLKVMMVYFLQKRFEMSEITISTNEETEKGMLLTQLEEYKIESYDSRGQPSFGGLDHILDGLMLSVFAIVENYHTIFDKNTGTYIGTAFKKPSPTEEINKFFNKNNEEVFDIRETQQVVQNNYQQSSIENFSFIQNHRQESNVENLVATSVKNIKKRRTESYEIF